MKAVTLELLPLLKAAGRSCSTLEVVPLLTVVDVVLLLKAAGRRCCSTLETVPLMKMVCLTRWLLLTSDARR